MTFKGFNGAGMFLSRKSHIFHRSLQGVVQASMGPGCFYPGNLGGQGLKLLVIMLQWGRDVSIPEILPPERSMSWTTGFNGAGMFLSRKCICCYGVITTPSCFNGAGMFLSRKSAGGPSSHDRRGRFYW